MPCQEAEGNPPKVHWEKVLSNSAGHPGLRFPSMPFWIEVIEVNLVSFQGHWVKIDLSVDENVMLKPPIISVWGYMYKFSFINVS